jgi:hypothetical protein
MGAGLNSRQHARAHQAVGIAFALQLELAGIDAARHICREHEGDVDRLGLRRAGQEKEHAGQRRRPQTAHRSHGNPPRLPALQHRPIRAREKDLPV